MQTWKLVVENWQPMTANQRERRHWRARSHRMRVDRDLLAGLALFQGIPRAHGRRRVDLTIVLGPRQTGADPDAWWKSTLDALVGAGLLLDDRRRWVQLGDVNYERGTRRATTITLTDL
jgi:hypothetical protein